MKATPNNRAPYEAFRNEWRIFYDLVEDFPDFHLEPGLDEEEIENLEQENEFTFSHGLKNFFRACSSLEMNGLKIRADELDIIQLPESPGLILGYLNLGSAADRLLMLPADDAIYYLEQHNGSITRIAASMDAFFNETLPRRLYG